MKSKTSLFSPTLFRKNLTRFAPLWAIFLAVMILAGPVTLLSSKSALSVFYSQSKPILYNYFVSQSELIIFFNFLYAPLCAGMLFRYLHKARSAYMMHAFPLNRSTQFVTNVLTGFVFAIVPFVLQFVLNLLAVRGLPCQSWLWKLLVIEILSFICFYGLSVFCMQISGNSIISALSYFILNFVFTIVPLMLFSLMDEICFGFDTGPWRQMIFSLSPMLRMMDMLSVYENGVNWIVYAVYGLIGYVLLVLSWLQYRVRHIERAGEAMVSRWSRVGFLILFTVSCTLVLGLILTDLFCSTAANWRKWLLPMLLFYLLSSFAGWFGAQMMLGRTVRVFKKRNVLGWVCAAAAAAALICGLHFDVFGVQRYVPELSNLQEAALTLDTQNYGSSRSDIAELTVTDPAVLKAVLEAHRDAYSYYSERGQTYNYQLSVCYRLNSGRTVNRQITMDNGTANTLSNFLDKPEYAVQYYQAILPELFLEDQIVNLDHYDPANDTYDETSLYCRDMDALRAAITQDAAEGNLPIPFCFSNESFNWHIWGDRDNLQIGDHAVHTLKLFGVEPE